LALWDVDTGRNLRQFPLKARTLGAQALLSPDGKILASGEFDVTLLDVATGGRLGLLNTGFIASLAFAPDGKMLAVGTDKDVSLWDVASRKIMRRMGHSGYFRAVVFTSDGKTLVTGGTDGTARQWDLADGMELRRWKSAGEHLVMRAEPSGERVAYADNGSIRLLDARNGTEVLLAGAAPGQRACLAFSRDGTILASGHADGSIHLWDPATAKETARWQTSGEMIESLAFAPDGKVLVSSDYRGSGVHWWDATTGKEVPRKWAGHNGYVKKMRFSADGKELFSLGADGSFYRWDAAAGVPRGSCSLPMSADASFSPDGREILTCECVDKVEYGAPMTLRFRDAGKGRILRSQDGAGVAFRISFSSDGRAFATAAAVKDTLAVSVWDTKSGKPRHQFTEPGGRGYFDLVLSPDGKKLAAGSWNTIGPNFHLWDLETDKKVATCVPYHWVNSIAFSPDGDSVALGSGGDWNKCVSLWRLSTSSLKQTFVIPPNVNDVVVAFSPGGRFLAAGGSSLHASLEETPDQNTIYVLEAATGQPVAKFPGNHSGVTALAFAPDGRTLASGGGDSTILIWDLIGRLRNPDTSAKPRTIAELDARWQALAGADAAGAYAAIGDLILGADASVIFLKSHLAAIPRPDAADMRRAERLATDLDSETFAVRQKAAEELEKMPVSSGPVLRKILAKGPGAETRRRIESLLSDFEALEATLRLRGSRALEVLETIATPPARNLVQELASGDPEAWLTREAAAARDRLIRAGKR
jgi:WD40 repeat protein